MRDSYIKILKEYLKDFPPIERNSEKILHINRILEEILKLST